jgi:hypothetical protein
MKFTNGSVDRTTGATLGEVCRGGASAEVWEAEQASASRKERAASRFGHLNAEWTRTRREFLPCVVGNSSFNRPAAFDIGHCSMCILFTGKGRSMFAAI